MPHPEAAASARFYDAIARDYDALLTSHPGDRWARDAFHALVDLHLRAGATLLDFGSGTGLDAVRFAERGFRVVACDNAPGMMAILEARCATQIPRGTVKPWLIQYDEFLAAEHPPTVDAVVSNFAVLNLLPHTGDLFRAFARMTAPGAVVIVSVLNPHFWRELGRMSASTHPASPRVPVDERSAPRFVHSVGTIVDGAHPHFRLIDRASVPTLVRRGAGRHAWSEPRTLAERLETRGWRSWPLNRVGQYLMLVFRRAA